MCRVNTYNCCTQNLTELKQAEAKYLKVKLLTNIEWNGYMVTYTNFFILFFSRINI